MRRVAGLSLLVGALALAAAVSLGMTMQPELLRSALAGWLVLIALPLGALPVLMALHLVDRDLAPGTASLRVLLAGLPLAALAGAGAFGMGLVAPHAVDLAALYRWSGTHGVAAAWLSPRWFCIRALVYLALWVILGLVFMRASDAPSARRRGVAAVGLGLHLVIGTLAAFDWTLSLDLGVNASAFGLLLMTLQSAFAVTAALLLTLAHDPTAPPPRLLVLILLALLGAAGFLQFTQYLVVWSANLPREIVWYQHRFAGMGTALFMIAPAVLLIAAIVLAPAWSSGRRRPVGAVAGLLLLFEVANLLWLVTPAWRGAFSISALDGLALLGLIGLVGASALLLSASSAEVRHG